MIIFLHIPKTAGTSLYDWFNEITDRKVGWYGPNNTPSVFFGNPENRDLCRVYGGHFDYLQIKPFLTPEDEVFSVVREPIARVASHFNHVAVRDKNHPLRKEVAGKSIVQAAQSSRLFFGEINNHQCWYLSCQRSFLGARPAIEEYRPRLFTVDELDFMTAELARLLGSRIVPKLERRNAAETEYFSELSNDDINYIREINKEDVQLYDWVLNNKDVRLHSH